MSSEKSVRNVAIDDATCPVCLQQGLGELKGFSRNSYTDPETGNTVEYPMQWWKSTCTNCRSITERYLLGMTLTQDLEFESTVTEEVWPTPHGLALRENRELKEKAAVK